MAPGAVVPNFLIVGAARSGTTSLYAWLKGHPEVFLSEPKEPTYFVEGVGYCSWNQYLGLFEGGRGKTAVGEASALYMSAPESARWIHETLPEARIVILLRNPVERAFSLYSWMTMEGHEWLPTFEQALDAEERRFRDPEFRRSAPQPVWDYLYVRSGLYHERVAEYLELFGPDQVRVYLFEDLVAASARVYTDLCAFLGIASGHAPQFVPHNASRRPRSVRLQYLLRSAWRRCRGAPEWRRLTLTRIMAMNRRWGRPDTLPPATRRALVARYRGSVDTLSRLLGRDCSGWLA